MKMCKKVLVTTIAAALSFGAQADITAIPSDDAAALVNSLLSVSGGATTSNEVVTPGVCSGTFSGGTTGGSPVEGGWGTDSGIMLSSGAIAGIAGPNVDDGLSTVLGTPGDPFLDGLVGGGTQDACILEFDFECPVGSAGSEVSFRYNFGSEEYNEFVNSQFNDVFGFSLNGSNIALLPDMITPVAINNVNAGLNAGLYNNNDLDDTATPYFIEADGFVTTLEATGAANLPVNHIKMAIADRGDSILDSWVGVEGGSFECTVQLNVDIKPGSNPNCIKPKAKGVVSVAFYSSADVDACTIDEGTLDYLGAGAVRCDCTDAPVTDPWTLIETYDGIDDLVCKFKKADMVGLPTLPDGDCITVDLTGAFLDGTAWEGSDHVCVPGGPACEGGIIQ
jgi:hypothetical protein